MFLLQFSLMSQAILHLPKETALSPEWSHLAGTAITAWNNQTESVCGLGFNGHVAQQTGPEFNVGVKFNNSQLTQQDALNLQLSNQTGYQLYNASWPSQPLQQVYLKKKIGKYFVQPDITKVKNIYQVPDMLQTDDIYDKRISK